MGGDAMIAAAGVLFLLLFFAQAGRGETIPWRGWVCLFGFAACSSYLAFREWIE